MKTNWVRRLAIKLAAVGLLSPAAALAAPLGTNLVTNPSFENIPGGPLSDWVGFTGTYAYSLNYTGAAPPGAGERFWFGGAGDVVTATLPPIDLSENAADIDDGRASYLLDAYFSNYLQQRDYGQVRATFLNAAAVPIGEA